MKEEEFETIKQEIQPYFKEVNPSHDFTHTERVMSLALHIGKKENADLEIIKLASLLHDIGRKEQDSSNGEICHAEAGAKIARDILKKHKYNDEKINKIIYCIETHRFRGDKIPESKEAKVLYDADKLDSIGAIGIGRAFFFAAQLNALIHIPNISVENTKEYSKEDTANREFFATLINVKDKMLTEEGKKIAEDRHQFMVSFFNRLDKEYIGEI